MAVEYKAISVDSHLQEKPDTWTRRMSKAKWGDRVPHIAEVDGVENWIFNGQPGVAVAICNAVMPTRLIGPKRWEEVPPMVYDADARLKAMDLDGVSAAVLYPNVASPYGDRFQGLEPELEAECVRAYNDYVAEEWIAVDPDRLFGLCVVPYSSIEATVAELKRAVARGHKGVDLLGTPQTRGLPFYGDPYWEPLWNTLEDLRVAANFHSYAGKPTWMALNFPEDHETRRNTASAPASGESFQAQHFAQLLFTGVIERHPTLNFAIAESGVGWVPYLLEACDHAWTLGQLSKHGLQMKPSEVFHRQCYVDFWFEYASIHGYRDIVGIERIMWEDDFPHPTALFPNTQELLHRSLDGLPQDAKRSILVENARRCYRIN
jgi:predicted TIM-barrel fold metal-dependent hydrolase